MVEVGLIVLSINFPIKPLWSQSTFSYSSVIVFCSPTEENDVGSHIALKANVILRATLELIILL